VTHLKGKYKYVKELHKCSYVRRKNGRNKEEKENKQQTKQYLHLVVIMTNNTFKQ
jgi:hypothetical protein